MKKCLMRMILILSSLSLSFSCFLNLYRMKITWSDGPLPKGLAGSPRDLQRISPIRLSNSSWICFPILKQTRPGTEAVSPWPSSAGEVFSSQRDLKLLSPFSTRHSFMTSTEVTTQLGPTLETLHVTSSGVLPEHIPPTS